MVHISLALNKYSGNFGILHQAVEGMFNSLGPTTRAVGSPCWSSGLDAFYYDFGEHRTSDLEEMMQADTIVLWGINPVWTSIHALPFLYRAKERGATLITIDPIYTATAKKSDLYIQVKPGGDGALAIAVAKMLMEKGEIDFRFIAEHTVGWEELRFELENISMEKALLQAGQRRETVERLASFMGKDRNLFIWIGFGLQRHRNGGQNIRSINALAAMTGNIGKKGSGVHFAHDPAWKFPHRITKHIPAGFEEKEIIRPVDINNFAEELLRMEDPPVKLLWISCRNLLTQNPDRALLEKVLSSMEMIITVDLFLTPTASISDIVLPAATPFEEWDLVASYWHHWISINQPAIAPYGESKSDLEIAKAIAKRLNERSPGMSAFPWWKSAEEFIEEEFTEEICAKLHISHWRELLNGPRKILGEETAWEGHRFSTPSGKFEFFSSRAKEAGLPPLSMQLSESKVEEKYPYVLLIIHDPYRLNSQFQNIPALKKASGEPFFLIHPSLAKKKGIEPGRMVRIYNDYGEVLLRAYPSIEISPDTLQLINGSRLPINRLIPFIPSDMGRAVTGASGMAFNDTRVEIEKI